MELSWILIGMACVMLLVLVQLHRMANNIYYELDDLIRDRVRPDDPRLQTFTRYLD